MKIGFKDKTKTELISLLLGHGLETFAERTEVALELKKRTDFLLDDAVYIILAQIREQQAVANLLATLCDNIPTPENPEELLRWVLASKYHPLLLKRRSIASAASSILTENAPPSWGIALLKSEPCARIASAWLMERLQQLTGEELASIISPENVVYGRRLFYDELACRPNLQERDLFALIMGSASKGEGLKWREKLLSLPMLTVEGVRLFLFLPGAVRALRKMERSEANFQRLLELVVDAFPSQQREARKAIKTLLDEGEEVPQPLRQWVG